MEVWYRRYAPDGSRAVVQASEPKPSRAFAVPGGGGGETAEYVMEEALGGDFALVKAWKGDTEGNLVYRKTARNHNLDHNPAIATAGRVTIAEVEEAVAGGRAVSGVWSQLPRVNRSRRSSPRAISTRTRYTRRA